MNFISDDIEQKIISVNDCGGDLLDTGRINLQFYLSIGWFVKFVYVNPKGRGTVILERKR